MQKPTLLYQFDWQSVQEDLSRLPLLELEYPDFLTEFAMGSMAIIDTQTTQKAIYFAQVDLAYFALNLPFALKNIAQNEDEETFVANMYQYYELILQKKHNTCLLTAKQPDSEDQTLILDWDSFYEQALQLKTDIFEALQFYYPHLLHHPQFELLKHNFYLQ